MPAVVEKHVHRFLEHPFLVPYDDIRGFQVDEPFEAVVSINDAPIEIVQIRGGESSAFKGNQGSQIRRQHRNDVHYHPCRIDTASSECIDDLQPFG